MDCGGLGTIGQNAAQHSSNSLRWGDPPTILTILSFGIEATRDQAALENQIYKILFVPDLPCTASVLSLKDSFLLDPTPTTFLFHTLVSVQFHYKQVDPQVSRSPGLSLI